MFSAIFASHQPYITTPVSPVTPPPAPPAPPVGIQPPVDEPIAFAATALPSLFGITGSAIASTTLATVTCADSAMTVSLSEAVPGLTFSYAASVLSVSGTPTTPTGVHRVVASYIASDGTNSVRGSTEHEITIVSASEVLTIGDMAGAVVRVGKPFNATLASPTSNYATDLVATANSLVPGCAISLAWTRGASSGSGTLSLAGTPTTAGTYALSVTFRAGDVVLGSSAHAVVVDAAYSAPSPAPAPAPAPSPPAPTPPPAATPAPAPGRGPDPFRDFNKVLMHFDQTGETVGYDPAIGSVLIGANDAVPSQNWFRAPWTHRQINPGLGNKVEMGRSGISATGDFTAAGGQRSVMTASISGADGSDGALTVECLVDIEQGAWNQLMAAGDSSRLCPLVMLKDSTGALVWLLGFASWMAVDGSGARRRIATAVGIAGLTSGTYTDPSTPFVTAIGSEIASRPGRFVHIAMGRKVGTVGQFLQAVWFDGSPGLYAADDQTAKLRLASPGTVSISGDSSSVKLPSGMSTWVPFRGGIDEVRVTAASRYSAFIALNPITIPQAYRVIPWPNYY